MTTNHMKIGIAGVVFFALLVFLKACAQTPKIAGFEKADLEAVMKSTGITYDGSLQDLVKVTQKEWKGAAQKERWEFDKIHEEKRNELLALFKKMGLVDAWEQKAPSYEHIFVMGATVPKMDSYIKTVQQLIANGIRYKEIVFLSGCRYLTDAEKEFLKKRGWDTIPETEAGVYPRLFEEYQIPIDAVVFINSPEVKNPDGTTWRPTMADNVKKWLATQPAPGSVLIISSQPFCHFQQVVAESLLPKEFVVTTIGEKASDNRPVAVYLDTLARTMYQWATTQK